MSNALFFSNIMFSASISAHGKLLYAALKKYSNKDGMCFPSRNTLAEACKISLSSIKKALKELCEAKVVKREKRMRPNGSQTSNLYTLASFLIDGDCYFPVRSDVFNLELSDKEKLVYMYLCRCCNKDGLCFPSQKQISEDCSICLSTVKSAIKKLVDYDLIVKINQYREDGGKRNNIYCVIGQAELLNKSDNPGNETEDIENFKNNNDEKEEKEMSHMLVRSDIFKFKVSYKAKLIYLYICTRCDAKNRITASHEEIALSCKIDLKQVHKSMIELEMYGLIKTPSDLNN